VHFVADPEKYMVGANLVSGDISCINLQKAEEISVKYEQTLNKFKILSGGHVPTELYLSPPMDVYI
jgi:hypothetical protein